MPRKMSAKMQPTPEISNLVVASAGGASCSWAVRSVRGWGY